MICFVCKKHIGNLAILIKHFRYFHGLKPYNIYQCLENSCLQFFSNLNSFKKHVQVKHINPALEKQYTEVSSNSTSNSNERIAEQPLEKTSLASSPLGNSCIHNPSTNNVSNSINKQCDQYDSKSYDFDVNKKIEILFESALRMCLNLYCHNNFTRKDVLNIQNLIKENIIKSIINPVKEYLTRFSNYKTDFYELDTFLANALDPFNLCASEHKLLKWLHKSDLIEACKSVTSDNHIQKTVTNDQSLFVEKEFKASILPLKFQFRKIFEHGNILHTTLKYIETCSTNITDKNLSNFVDGDLWRSKKSNFQGKNVVPYFLYFDDFEINNPLGSHAGVQSITAAYYNFPVLFNNSKLDNIFVAGLFKAKNFKDFGSNYCLDVLINDIISLEKDGLDLTVNNNKQPIRVYFVLGLILGDNLGINSILCFTKSFGAKYFCRFCKSDKNEVQLFTDERQLLLRNIKNYENDLLLNDKSKTGIEENSIFNNIPSFHTTTNFAVDIMHDIFEGIAHYNVCHVILYFIQTLKVFTLEQLNFRKQNINYGKHEVGNVSLPIKLQHLQNKHLKMSAREMMTFINFLPLIIGDLIPENNEVWMFFIDFIKIVDILLATNISHSTLEYLRILISNHLILYKKLFHDTIKPKHHFLVHYVSVIKQSGPLRNFWTFRFESKHKEFKVYAHSAVSRINPCLTLAKKYQLKFSNYILNLNDLDTDDILNGNRIETSYSELIDTFLKREHFNTFTCYDKLEYKNTIYEKKQHFTIFDNDKTFCVEIIEIIVVHTSAIKTFDMLFVCLKNEIRYDAHYEAYQFIEDLNNTTDVISIKQINGPPIHICYLANGKRMIRLKEYF